MRPGQPWRRFPRFRELTPTDCNVELHVHTTWTDGRASIAEVLAAARAAGLATIALTEHVRRGSQEWFGRFAADVRRTAEDFSDLEVLVGCEAKALAADGTPASVLDVDPAVIEESDMVLGSVHRFPAADGGLLNFADLDRATMARMEAELASSLLRYAPIDVLAHPGGMYQRRHGVFPENLMREIVTTAVERGIAVEISTSYLKDVRGFLDICRSLNPYVSIGSDAHSIADIGSCRAAVTAYLAEMCAS